MATNAQLGIFGYDGTGTATTTATQISGFAALMQQPVKLDFIIIQNPTGGSISLIVGYSNSPQMIVVPGKSITLPIATLGNIYIASASSTTSYNWISGSGVVALFS